jgi:hypothetical protein
MICMQQEKNRDDWHLARNKLEDIEKERGSEVLALVSFFKAVVFHYIE